MIEIFIWVFFAVVIGYAAFRRGRSGFGWFLLGILISPLLAGFLLLAFPIYSALPVFFRQWCNHGCVFYRFM